MAAFDLIVAGGGVVGATAAYRAAREGLRTRLLDRLDAGRATDAGAGIISPEMGTRNEGLFALGLGAAAYYPALLGQLDEDGGGDTSYAVCGDLRVAVTEDELASFDALLALLETRVALRPLSADGLPVLGAVSGVAGAYLATGHGPSGLTLGPYSARLVVDLMLDRPPAVDLRPFSAGRFRRAEPRAAR